MKKLIEVGDVFRTISPDDLHGGQDLKVVRIETSEGRHSHLLSILDVTEEGNKFLDAYIYFEHEKAVKVTPIVETKHFRARVWWVRDCCERVFNRDEKSLLMYFETCLVDNFGGEVQGARMNSEDMNIAEKFERLGLIKFGRLPFRKIEKERKIGCCIPHTHYVRFIDEDAWTLAHKWRRERAERLVIK